MSLSIHTLSKIDTIYTFTNPNVYVNIYFSSFMWQICGHIPQTLLMHRDITCYATQLSVSFFIETFIHAKEKVNIFYSKYII